MNKDDAFCTIFTTVYIPYTLILCVLVDANKQIHTIARINIRSYISERNDSSFSKAVNSKSWIRTPRRSIFDMNQYPVVGLYDVGIDLTTCALYYLRLY